MEELGYMCLIRTIIHKTTKLKGNINSDGHVEVINKDNFKENNLGYPN